MSNLKNRTRAIRIRKKLKKVKSDRFRLTVSRSSRNISAQIIDDKNSKTLVSASSLKEKTESKKKIRHRKKIEDFFKKFFKK